MKTEPSVYSIEDLKKETVTPWEGVRNYQARNFMRDKMKVGDEVLIYHSNASPPGVVGLATVCKEAYPDFFALDNTSRYFDPKASKEKPIWMMVDVKYKETFEQMISLDDIRQNGDLDGMMVTQKGSRLSIQPVEKNHYDIIVKLGKKR